MALVLKSPPANAGDANDVSSICGKIRKIPWRRAWPPTPGFLPGDPHGQRSLTGCSPWGHKVRRDWSDLAQWWRWHFKSSEWGKHIMDKERKMDRQRFSRSKAGGRQLSRLLQAPEGREGPSMLSFYDCWWLSQKWTWEAFQADKS